MIQRFTLRDLFWLTVVVAMELGWWMETRHRGPENMRLRESYSRLSKEHFEVWQAWRKSEENHD